MGDSTSGAATRRVRVAARRTVGVDIDEFVLIAEDGNPLPSFTAGAHIDVHPAEGIVRQYSLCGSTQDLSRYEIAVLRQPSGRGGSCAVHDELSVGRVLSISTPRQNFPLDESASHSILVAGGVGITPLLAMVKRLGSIGRSFELHHRARSAEHAAFMNDLRSSHFAPSVHWHLGERGDPAAEGALAELFSAFDRKAIPNTHVYVCGPEGMMTAMLDAARTAGWPEALLHSEAFTASTALTSGETFEVKFERSRKSVTVGPSETIVEAALRVGVEIETSCEQGVCGTCVTRVISGKILHRDTFLTPPEHASGTLMTPCCSRAAGTELVLDT